MAHHTEQVGFPAIPLTGGMKLRLAARNPTTDATVAGVSASLWSIYGRDKSPGTPFADEVPTYIPEDTSVV